MPGVGSGLPEPDPHVHDRQSLPAATLTVSDGQIAPLSDSDTVKITVAAGGGGGGGSFQDTFNRAGFRYPRRSEPERDPVGRTGERPYTGNLAIAGNQLMNAARGDNIGYLPTLTGANQSASGDFISTDNNASPRLGVLLRYQDARNHYRLYRISGGSSQLRISKFINGAETILKSVQVPMAPRRIRRSIWSGSVVGSTLTLTCDRCGARSPSTTRRTRPGASACS